MGKWSFLKSDSRFATIAPDADYADKVTARKEAIAVDVLASAEYAVGDVTRQRETFRRMIAERYNAAREEKDRIAEQESAVNLEIAALEATLLEQMEAGGLESFRSDGFTFTDYVEPVAKVEDKTALLAWIKANGLEELLTLPWQTLNAYVKEALGPGGDGKLPEGAGVGIRRQIRRVKASR